MKSVQTALLVLAIFGTPCKGFAERALPSDLIGLVSVSTLHFPWSLTIDSRTPDGAIQGRMSVYGVSCNFENQRVDGIYRDIELPLARQRDAIRRR